MSAPVVQRNEFGEFNVTVERAEDGIWTVTAAALDDETLAQYTTDDEADALMLADNLLHCDLSDLT